MGIYPRERKTHVHPKTCMQMLIAALLIIAKKLKQLLFLSIDEWINNTWYIHTILFGLKKE